MPLHLTWHVSVLLTTIFMPQQNEVNFSFREGVVSLPSFSEKRNANEHTWALQKKCMFSNNDALAQHEDVRNVANVNIQSRFVFNLNEMFELYH